MNKDEIITEVLEEMHTLKNYLDDLIDKLEGTLMLKCEICKKDKMEVEFNVALKKGWCNECYEHAEE